MLINQNELEKLCKYLYPKFFDYKDISLYDLNIKIDDYRNKAESNSSGKSRR